MRIGDRSPPRIVEVLEQREAKDRRNHPKERSIVTRFLEDLADKKRRYLHQIPSDKLQVVLVPPFDGSPLAQKLRRASEKFSLTFHPH